MYRKFSLIIYLAFIFLVLTGTAYAQSKNGSISGSIKTSDGNPAAFVSVGLKNTSKTTQTDEQGNFTIRNVSPGKYTIKISAVGVKVIEKSVTVTADNESKISFATAESSSQLDEVAINGYRTPNKKPSKSG
ncbi:carboxypeptidase-like regulatory domain-containing protein [Pedobacter agri]|uniref:carboxypeptidase-like regulatory domain-containing protein n=1 Tax=Pedobacter agri TaxID=454586 RepID=UPI00031ACFA4|nr:carboxypeptidase-like regulatory domain-containing protein [Pedobacter agri]